MLIGPCVIYRETQQPPMFVMSPRSSDWTPSWSSLLFMFEMFPLSVCPYMYFSQAYGFATGFATQALSPLKLPLCLKTSGKSLNVISGICTGRDTYIQPCSTAHDLFPLKWHKKRRQEGIWKCWLKEVTLYSLSPFISLIYPLQLWFND